MKSPTGSKSSLLLAVLLALAAPAVAAEGDPITVLITHPRAGELFNIARLAERGLLNLHGMRLVGVYHTDEWENYQDANQYIADTKLGWIELREISCRLDEKSVFDQNECTPIFRELFESSHAAIFTGGPDIPPSLYGERTLLTTVIEDPPRHLFEISFLFHLLGGSRNTKPKPLLDARPDYVVLGLCLGMQSMNVAAGGTLTQDIPSEVYRVKTFEEGLSLPPSNWHRSFRQPLYPALDVGSAVIHPIRFTGRSALTKALATPGESVRVVSLHHQAVEKLGQGLVVLASSVDKKVVEALGHRKYSAVLGVQFHPEKGLIWEPEALYLERDGAAVPNYVADWFSKDKRAQEFHQSFWRLVGELIRKSAGASP